MIGLQLIETYSLLIGKRAAFWFFLKRRSVASDIWEPRLCSLLFGFLFHCRSQTVRLPTRPVTRLWLSREVQSCSVTGFSVSTVVKHQPVKCFAIVRCVVECDRMWAIRVRGFPLQAISILFPNNFRHAIALASCSFSKPFQSFHTLFDRASLYFFGGSPFSLPLLISSQDSPNAHCFSESGRLSSKASLLNTVLRARTIEALRLPKNSGRGPCLNTI